MTNYNDFNLPVEFEIPTTSKAIGNGVEASVGGIQTVPFKFVWVSRPLPELSKNQGYLLREDIPAIQFFKSKYNAPVERLRRKRNRAGGFDYCEKTKKFIGEWVLPPEYNREPFITEFSRWQKANSEPGLTLDKWEFITPGQIALLADLGIFTLQAFANRSQDWVKDSLPTEFLDLYNHAVLDVMSREGVAKLGAENAELKNKVAELEAMISGRGDSDPTDKPKAKSKSKKKNKVTVTDGVISI